MLELVGRYRLNSTDEFPGHPGYLRIDNTGRTPDEVAEDVIAHCGLVA